MNRVVCILSLVVMISCNSKKNNIIFSSPPLKVQVKNVEGKYNFYINDSLFKLKGIGFNFGYRADFENLKKTGANAIRTWSTKNADTILSAAKEYDLMVALGIDIGKELWGFDYNDTLQVAKQFEKVKSIIKTYKNHPNLLCWVVGNELNLLFEEDGETLKMVNPKVYNAMSDIVDFIHKEDPNHPVTITFAGAIPEHLKVALHHIPQLDFVSVQVYAGLETIEQNMKDSGVDMPYLVSEYGPKGFWEMPKTDWNREIEEASGPKADGIKLRIVSGLINNQSGKCLGGFAFVWGNKHERTPTWFGMHHSDGKQTEYIDNLTKLWTGKYPENQAPRVESLLLDGKKSIDNVYLRPNKVYMAKVDASDPNGDVLGYKWEIAEEVNKRSQGGGLEEEPKRLDVKVLESENGAFKFVSPSEEGEYRILSYVYDNNGKAGNANIPFYVKK